MQLPVKYKVSYFCPTIISNKLCKILMNPADSGVKKTRLGLSLPLCSDRTCFDPHSDAHMLNF